MAAKSKMKRFLNTSYLGGILGIRRRALHMNQGELGEKVGVGRCFISTVESGANPVPLARVNDLVETMKMPDFMRLAYLYSCNPEAFTIFHEAFRLNKAALDMDLNSTIDAVGNNAHNYMKGGAAKTGL